MPLIPFITYTMIMGPNHQVLARLYELEHSFYLSSPLPSSLATTMIMPTKLTLAKKLAKPNG